MTTLLNALVESLLQRNTKEELADMVCHLQDRVRSLELELRLRPPMEDGTLWNPNR
jgi:hypothetical protein